MLDLKDKTGKLLAFFELALMEATLLISFVACNNSSIGKEIASPRAGVIKLILSGLQDSVRLCHR